MPSKGSSKKSPNSSLEVGDITSGRDVNIAGRDIYQTNITYNLQVPAFRPPPDLEQLRAAYLEHLRRAYRALDFKGIPQLDTFARELLLEDVYVPLVARPELPSGETWERRLAGRKMEKDTLPEEALAVLGKGESVPLRVEEAVGQNSCLVVLGDPGSGKSTLIKHLALRLAAEADAPLPIILPLNAYADAALQRADLNLQAYLPQHFAGLAQGLADLAPLFDRAIAQGQAVILLDGLDEVQSNRPHLVQKVEAFAAEAVQKGCKLVVTSRIVGYREAPLDVRVWSLYTLLDFDRAAIEQFAARWCIAFEKSTLGDTPEASTAAETERRALLEAIEANPGVAQLASNPLLLTILALIKRQGVSLPNHRVELYELYLKTLISAWSKARTLDKRPVGPPLDYLKTIAVLGPLALWLREDNPTAGLVPEERLVEWLTNFFKSEDWGMKQGEAMQAARAFLDSVRTYSNLLLERGQGRYGFIHLTFEEALAARGLVQAGQLNLENSLVYIRKYLAEPAWRETILLAVGVWGLVREQPRVAGEVVRLMLKMDCGSQDPCRNVLMAGACLQDVGETGLGRPTAHEVIAALQKTSLDRSLPPVVQRDAGFCLGRLALHPPFLELIRPDLDDFVLIPAGPFIYGEKSPGKQPNASIEQPFEIAKYPVTNLQYRRFVEAGSYNRKEFWSGAGWAWRTGESDSQQTDELGKRALEARPVDRRGEPALWHDPRWNNPLAPVVGVCWFEAEAYCCWLSQAPGCAVRLPTEQEWERAARGPQGRAYPWGDKFDRTRLNCAEFWAEKDDLSDYDKWKKEFLDSKIYESASTTQVGQFPEGAAPEKIHDLSGNVWEWVNSWVDSEQKHRIVRGGSWFGYRWRVHAAYRYWSTPVGRGDVLGFRCVRSP